MGVYLFATARQSAWYCLVLGRIQLALAVILVVCNQGKNVFKNFGQGYFGIKEAINTINDLLVFRLSATSRALFVGLSID